MNNASTTLIAAAVFATAGLAYAQTDRSNSGNGVDSSHKMITPSAGDDAMPFDRRPVGATPHVSTQRNAEFNRDANPMNGHNRTTPRDSRDPYQIVPGSSND